MSAGIGAMLHYLGGGSQKSASDYYGREIAKAAKGSDSIILTFSDGVSIEIRDKGQSCCERRYMNIEDNLEGLVGKKLRAIETKSIDSPQGEYGDEHEIVFLEIQTEDGMVGCSFHNEHNGYYGGFGLNVSEIASS